MAANESELQPEHLRRERADGVRLFFLQKLREVIVHILDLGRFVDAQDQVRVDDAGCGEVEARDRTAVGYPERTKRAVRIEIAVHNDAALIYTDIMLARLSRRKHSEGECSYSDDDGEEHIAPQDSRRCAADADDAERPIPIGGAVLFFVRGSAPGNHLAVLRHNLFLLRIFRGHGL